MAKRIKHIGPILPKLSVADIAKALGASEVYQIPAGWHPWMGRPPKSAMKKIQ